MSRPVSGGGDRETPRTNKVVPIREHLFAGTGLSTRSAADMTDEFLAIVRQRFLKGLKFPTRPMGKLNYRWYMRFLRLTQRLDDYELAVIDTLEGQSAEPSSNQRRILWRAMKRIFPEGCSGWGRP